MTIEIKKARTAELWYWLYHRDSVFFTVLMQKIDNELNKKIKPLGLRSQRFEGSYELMNALSNEVTEMLFERVLPVNVAFTHPHDRPRFNSLE
jgi:hypothetical protein